MTAPAPLHLCKFVVWISFEPRCGCGKCPCGFMRPLTRLVPA